MRESAFSRSPSGAFNDIRFGFFEKGVTARKQLDVELEWVCHLSCALSSRAPEEVLSGILRRYLYGSPPVPAEIMEDWAIHCLAYIGYGASSLALRLLAAELDQLGLEKLRTSGSSAAALGPDLLYDKGIALYAQLDADRIPAQIKNYSAISDEYYKQVMRLFGCAFERPSLSIAQREAATVCILACAGTEESQLAFHTAVAMKFGLTAEDLVEILMLIQWYAGLPRANNVANQIKRVLEMTE